MLINCYEASGIPTVGPQKGREKIVTDHENRGLYLKRKGSVIIWTGEPLAI